MIKAIELAKKISKQPDKNWLSELENNNLHKIFYPVYLLNQDIVTLNTIVVFIIYAYDNDSNWIDLKKDRIENKKDILIGLGINYEEEIYQSLINSESEEFQNVIADYLKNITTWKWKTIMSCFDYHAINIQKSTEPTKVSDELEGAKINKAKGDLLREAIRQRDVGEQLLKEIKSEFVKTDRATQTDFGFEITDEHKINVESWRDYIKYKVNPLKQKSL